MNEQLHKKINEVLNEKSDHLEKIEELELNLKTTKEKLSELVKENDRVNLDFSEKLRLRDVQLEKMNDEIKHSKSTVRS